MAPAEPNKRDWMKNASQTNVKSNAALPRRRGSNCRKKHGNSCGRMLRTSHRSLWARDSDRVTNALSHVADLDLFPQEAFDAIPGIRRPVSNLSSPLDGNESSFLLLEEAKSEMFATLPMQSALEQAINSFRYRKRSLIQNRT